MLYIRPGVRSSVLLHTDKTYLVYFTHCIGVWAKGANNIKTSNMKEGDRSNYVGAFSIMFEVQFIRRRILHGLSRRRSQEDHKQCSVLP